MIANSLQWNRDPSISDAEPEDVPSSQNVPWFDVTVMDFHPRPGAVAHSEAATNLNPICQGAILLIEVIGHSYRPDFYPNWLVQGELPG